MKYRIFGHDKTRLCLVYPQKQVNVIVNRPRDTNFVDVDGRIV
ncbi:hypothetical protein PTUN_b0558 [Pseudoalteromonas tunicata]|nr:hypothetical protein PTUN_b0558 [Pseudoalteromonas tunicata]